MTFDDYCTARAVIDAAIEKGYREHSDGQLAAATAKEHELIAKVERYYGLGDRGFVHTAFGKYAPVVHVHLKDGSRLQETSLSPGEWTSPPLTTTEIEYARDALRELSRWCLGQIATLPGGISRDEAYRPWKERLAEAKLALANADAVSERPRS